MGAKVAAKGISPGRAKAVAAKPAVMPNGELPADPAVCVLQYVATAAAVTDASV